MIGLQFLNLARALDAYLASRITFEQLLEDGNHSVVQDTHVQTCRMPD